MPDTSTLNDQILDEVHQTAEFLKAGQASVLAAAAYQAMAQTLTLALQNAVAQQQHNAILRNAMTTAAANAILQGKKAEAEAILALAGSALASPSLAEIMHDLKEAFQLLREELKAASDS